MMNDQVDDPTSTYIPTTWRPILDQSTTMHDIFFVMKLSDNNTLRTYAFKCAQQLANIRPGIFENVENRVEFLTKFI